MVATDVIGVSLAGQRGQPGLLLLVGPELEDGVGEEAVGAQQVADAEVADAQLLLDQALGDDVGEPAAAVLLGKHEAGDADLGRLAPQVPGRLDVGLVDGAGHRADLVAGEVAAQVDDRLAAPRSAAAVRQRTWTCRAPGIRWDERG